MEPTNNPIPPPAIPRVLEYGRADLVRERPLLYVGERIFHAFTALLLPIACFLISAESYPPGPEWQRGQWLDYLGLIPTARVGWPFYPLLLFSMYCAGRMIFATRRAINVLHVRIGLLAGIVLAWQYAFIQTVSIAGETGHIIADTLLGIFIPAAAVTIVIVLHRLMKLLIWDRQWFRGRGRVIFWLAVAVLVAGLMIVPSVRQDAFGAVAISALFTAPGLTMTTFVSLAAVCFTRGEKLEHRAWPVYAWTLGWLAAFAAAWIKSYAAAIDAYYQLPPSNSSCYIATAAAQGHPAIVRSWPIAGRRVNHQLAMFKAGEGAFSRRWPRVHRTFRLVYDLVGPSLARQLDRAWLADAAYLTLKPLEWLTAAVMAMGARRTRSRAQGVRTSTA